MLTVHVENIGDMAILACEGRLVRSEAAFTLRDAITSQRNARTIIVDLSEVQAIEGGGLGMLTAMLSWAKDHDIELKLFNPTHAVETRLENYDFARFDIASPDEMIALMSGAEHQHIEIRHNKAA